MKKSNLLKLLENIGDEDSIDEVLSQTAFAKELKNSGATLDTFKSKIDDPDFKSFLDSVKDTHFNKALQSWKDNNLNKIVDSELLKRNPSKTPEQLQIEELTKKFEAEQQQRKLSEQKSKLKDELRDKNVDPRIIDLLINQDEDITRANLALYVEANKPFIQKEIENRMKAGQYVPPSSDKEQISQLEKQMDKIFGL